MPKSTPQPPSVGASPFDMNDYRLMETQLRELADCMALISRCEKCNIPVESAKADAQALINYFQGILAEFRGPTTGSHPAS